ncbi:hypothetical protein GCM10010193_03350 [Kitasatospora atroaurantiaca]|uniref:Uncharacterized protein n=1 Tax=Kitasatospora atroaurantiaca TaxID=285545 RepID=A0A561ELQ5_9ACTN|nr:hypothetical protein FB465_1537 [Kitasatospora atroaurantiaca]
MGPVTVPNTPAGPGAEPTPDANPYAVGPDLQPLARERRPLLPELRIAVLTTVACVLLGVVVGLLWLWLAPRVMLVATSDAIRYVDPEGEQRAGADSVFALLGLGAGVLTALVAFLLSRGRGGGVAVAVGLAVGGLAGSLVAWQVGMRLGPGTDVIANAKHAGQGVEFSAAIELGARGALLVWPMTAMVLLLALSAAFGKREQDPPPYWAGPQWSDPTPGSSPKQQDGDAPTPPA